MASAPVAQWIEQWVSNPLAVGSIPTGGTKYIACNRFLFHDRIGTYLRTFMTTISYTQFRQHLAHFLDKAEEDCNEIVVTRNKGRKSIIISFADFASLQETAYLLSSEKNRKHLEKSIREADAGKTVRVKL